jgi:transcriptional regulator with XRE-family HTH domain
MFLTQTKTDEENLSKKRRPSLDPDAQEVLAKLDESSPLSEQLRTFSKDLRLRDRELTALAGVSRATLARWRKDGDGERPPQLDDLRVIAILLIRSGALRPRSVAGWLRSRNRGLAWQRPLEVLGRKEFSRVLSTAEATCGGRVPVEIPPQGEPAKDDGVSLAPLPKLE